MTTVAALGFGDIPPAAFVGGFNLIETPGLLAFTIKDDFLGDDDPSGFSRLIQRMFTEKTIVPLAEEPYRHRLSVHGKPLDYIAFVARKTGDVPAALDPLNDGEVAYADHHWARRRPEGQRPWISTSW